MTRRIVPHRSRGPESTTIDVALVGELAELLEIDPDLGSPLGAARYAVLLALRQLRTRTIGFSLDAEAHEGLRAIERRVEIVVGLSEAARYAVHATWDAIRRGVEMPPARSTGPTRPTGHGLKIDGRTYRRLDVISGSIEGLVETKRSPALCYAIWYTLRTMPKEARP